MDDSATQPLADGPTAVLVEGMHASGTALLSRLVALVMHGHPDQAAHPDDPWLADLIQNGAIAGMNRRILEELGASWSNPGALFLRGRSIADSTPPIREAIRGHYLQSAIGIARSGATGGGPVILEDPNICLLRDLWDAALRAMGHCARTIHIFRNPLEVAASLKQTDGLQQSRTLQLWVQYNLAALTAPGREPPLIVHYAELTDSASGLIARLAAYLNKPAPVLGETEMRPAWRTLIQPTGQEAGIPDHVVARSPLVPSIVKRLFALLKDWAAQGHEQRAAELRDLAAVFEDQTLFAGNLIAVMLPAASKPVAPVVSSEAGGTRKLLIHYHFFKNAGTSVDAILHRNFGDRWINTEFPPRGQVDHQEAIRLFVRDNPRLAAISSHTLMLPAPRIDGIEVFPILFVRHPLDRIKSAYEFERKQDARTIGAKIAKEQDFAGYIRARLGITNDRACRDFQVTRLAMAMPAIKGSPLAKAMAAADQLPFVGLVEAFDASAQRLQQLVQPMFPEFQSFAVKANVTPTRRDKLEERLQEIQRELGSECFGLLIEANQGDLALYAKLRASYAMSSIPAGLAEA